MVHPALANGSVAVVTGAGSGIGLAAARYLSGLGLRICLVDLDGARLQVARDRLIALGVVPQNLMIHPTDVGDKAQILALTDAVLAAFGAVNVLINNAATCRVRSLVRASAPATCRVSAFMLKKLKTSPGFSSCPTAQSQNTPDL